MTGSPLVIQYKPDQRRVSIPILGMWFLVCSNCFLCLPVHPLRSTNNLLIFIFCGDVLSIENSSPYTIHKKEPPPQHVFAVLNLWWWYVSILPGSCPIFHYRWGTLKSKIEERQEKVWNKNKYCLKCTRYNVKGRLVSPLKCKCKGRFLFAKRGKLQSPRGRTVLAFILHCCWNYTI